MKTAMQELIEYLGASNPMNYSYFLELEKEQIIEAWIATDNELQRIAAEEYYNQKYKQYGLDDETRQILNNL